MSTPDLQKLATLEAKLRTTIAFQIQKLRKERGWSQEELSEKSGVHQRSLSNYESQSQQPSFLAMVRIAMAFDVPIDTFIAHETGHAVQPDKSDCSGV